MSPSNFFSTKEKPHEVKKMNSAKERIGWVVNSWIDKEELPVRATLEEIEDSKEFIRRHLRKDFEALLQIPVKPVKKALWFDSYEDYLESAFNTYDFQKTQIRVK